MSHTTEATDSTFTSLCQWNPVEMFNINFKPNGLLFCCGIAVKSGELCRWELDKGPMHDLLTKISQSSPQAALKSLFSLSELALCKKHQSQKWDLEKKWRESINHLLSTRAELNPVELDGSSPSYQPEKDSQLVVLTSPDANVSGSPQTCDPLYQTQNNHSESCDHCAINEGQLLREIKSLKAQVNALEAECKNMPSLLHTQKTSRWPWACFGARLKALYTKHRVVVDG